MLVKLTVNGERHALDLEPRRTLAAVLAAEAGLSSAHLGCGDGTCGACTVLVDGEATRSCLMLAVQCDELSVRTVEGLPFDHPLRAALAEGDGRCLPGLVMLAAGALEQDPGLAGDPERLRELLAANVCLSPDHEANKQAVIRAAS